MPIGPHSQRLIEVSLPLAAISEQSAREKSIRHGHISTLHIWWARRPLAAMRAAIFAALVPAPESEAERAELEELIKVIVNWDQVKDGNSAAIEQAKAIIRRHYPDGPPKLLDPFMGGGSTGLEALRLGCETYAVELNPVAHLVELCTLVYPQKYGQPTEEPARTPNAGGDSAGWLAGMADAPKAHRNRLAEDVRKWGQWVLERARADIGHLYANPAGDETIVGYLWARTVKCPNPACGAEMPLVRSWWLAKTGKRQIAVRPRVDSHTRSVDFDVVELNGSGQNGTDFDPSIGTSNRSAATCLVCHQVADKQHVKNEGLAGRIGQVVMAVIYESPDAAGKSYRPATDAERDLFEEATQLLNQHRSDGLSPPDEPIPSGSSRAIFVYLYGLTRWGDLFNPRQALALLTFTQHVHAAHDAMVAEGMDAERARAVATYLALAVDRQADMLSTLTRWVSQGEFVANTFGRQALPMIWDYAEVNPFSDLTGSWSSALRWIVLVIEHTSRAGDSHANALQGTATRLPHADAFFDAIITDPPYYDAVPYADLSDFFYVWLKRSVGHLYPDVFRTPLTPKAAEIIQEPARQGNDRSAKAFYEREMTRAFAEARRVLKPNGIFTVVFAHKSTSAWETLINGLLNAGLVVTASWPLHTERPGRLRAHDSAALASSIFIVCRARQAETDGYFDDIREELVITIRERLDYFWQQGIRGADFFISAIGPAVSVFGRYSRVYRLDGTEVGVGELLDVVQTLVAEYALDRILNGGASQVGEIDTATRYYIVHRWSYGQADVPFDDAMRLAMALGADVASLMERHGLLKQRGEAVALLGPRDRATFEDLGLPDRSQQPAPVIDVLHHAVALWERGKRLDLAEFLAQAAQGREEKVRFVGQAIIHILPTDDAERRLLEGFLTGRDSLPAAAVQVRLHD